MPMEKTEKIITVDLIDKFDFKIEVRRLDQFFSHKDDDGTVRHFAVDAMYRFAEEYSPICKHIKACNMAIETFPLGFIRREMGVEQPRLDRLIEPYLTRPVIGIQWPPSKEYPQGTMTLVDGNHRVIKLADRGDKSVKCYLFSEPLWEKFTLDIGNWDESHLKMDSRILTIEDTKRAASL